MSWDIFREELVRRLNAIPSLTCAAMGGGHGLSSGETFFGIIERGRFYLKVDDSTRPTYEEMGSGPFRVKGGLMESFYEVPYDVREDDALLLEWANRSLTVARRSPPAKS